MFIQFRSSAVNGSNITCNLNPNLDQSFMNYDFRDKNLNKSIILSGEINSMVKDTKCQKHGFSSLFPNKIGDLLILRSGSFTNSTH